jgi:hypothetical protein
MAMLCFVGGGANAQGREETRRFEQGDRIVTLRWLEGPDSVALDVRYGIELRSPGATDAMGGRSMAGEVAVDCQGKLTRLKFMRVYAEPQLKGAVVREFPTQTAWVEPEPTSLVRAVLEEACRYFRPASRTRPGAAARAPASSAAAPTGAVSVTTAATPPAPRPETSARAAAPARVAAPQPAPPAPAGAAAGRYRIQAGSYLSASDAAAQGGVVRGRVSELPAARVEAAAVGGRTHHRVLFDGFASQAAAEAACRRVREAGAPCLVKSAP